MKTLRLISVVIFFLQYIIITNVFAKPSNNISLLNFTDINGLSNNGITVLFQDSEGYLWIGSKDGLNRYNGYEFDIFKNYYGDSNTISNNWITTIDEDVYGNIWIGTISGLNVLTKKDQVFNRYSEISSQNSISANEIQAIKCDNAGNTWVKTEKYLDKINYKSNAIYNFQFYNDVFNPEPEICKSTIYIDKNRNLWIGTKDGLNYFDRALEQFKRFYTIKNNDKSLSNNFVVKIFEDIDGNLWIGAKEGLNKYDRKNNIFQHFIHDINVGNNESNCITDIYQYDNENLLIGTEKGLLVFNINNKTFQYYDIFYKNSALEFFRNNYITSIIRDNSNIFWIGTDKKGLFKLNENGKKFNLYSPKNKKLSFLENNIQSIFIDRQDNIWIGTENSGLYILNRKTLNIKNKYNNNHGLSTNFISCFKEFNNDEIIIGTNNGIFIKTQNSIKAPIRFMEESDVFINNMVYCIIESKDHSIWFASEKGLHKYANNFILSFYKENDTNKISSNRVFALAEDHNNNIWVGTDNGLDKINIATNEIMHFNSESKKNALNLSDNRIFSLLIDSLNILWIGTSNGLNKFDLNEKQFQVYTEFEGLANNVIYSLLDEDIYLWVSTNKGISRINKKSGEILNFDIIDGIYGYDFIIGGSFKSAKEEMFFVGHNGINYYYPDSIKLNMNNPNIVITAFELYRKGGKTKISIQDGDTVFIPYESNHFTIEFAALDFTRPEKCNYAYYLKGMEDEWINIGNNRKATFSNIPSGNYNFKVKGSNNDNLWNEKGTSLFLIVETPFWKGKIAIGLYSILVIVIFIFLFQYRTNKLRKSNKILRDKEFASLEVEKQREELIIKNKNITDSINYAKRIQEAIMPSEKYFKRILPSSFILYMPKDIVSGDFYWIGQNNSKVFLAVVDCTGHGVPGAFMSLIGFELLRNITMVQKIEDPSEVLNMLNTGVANTFNKDYEFGDITVKDGMDMAFCVINKETKILEFAGAFNPLYLVRENKIIEVKADRYTVGLLKEDQSYTKHIVPLDGVDMIYLFTDGYTDQFGGPEEKKFKFRRFRHLLLTIHKLTMVKQRLFLKESIEKWMNEVEQVDDILVIGINPNEL